MWGYGWGYGRGFGRGRSWWGLYGHRTPQGYTYVGPCRCGFGPHAFYADSAGRLVHASRVWGGWVPPYPSPSRSEAEDLKAEKADLEARLKEIEARLKELGGSQ